MTSFVPHQGIWPALLTPLLPDGDVDVPKLYAHAQRLIGLGCAGVTLFGTTGEGPSFSVAERMATLDGLLALGLPAQRVLVHTSCAALPDVVTLSQHATAHGCHGVLLAPPFFMKGVPDAGILDAFDWVFDRVPGLRVVLYHIPQVTGVALSHEVLSALLAKYPTQILGLKDSGCQREPSVERAHAFMQKAPHMPVWVGNEPDIPTLAALGTNGAVSGIANMMPGLVQRLVANGPTVADELAGDLARVQAFLAVMGGYALIPALKGVMAILDNDEAWLRVRPPFKALDAAGLASLREQMTAFGLQALSE